MKYPLRLSFKILTLVGQIYIHDADQNLLGYVRQKFFKLKEDINIFADEAQSELLYNIKADRVLDFSAQYNFTDATGRSLGAIKRKGMRSIFKANYQIYDGYGTHSMNINEENPWIKVGNALFGELPVIGMFTGYFFNPSYIVSRIDGTPVARLVKQPAFFEGVFQLEPKAEFGEGDETLVVLSVLTMTLLERQRG